MYVRRGGASVAPEPCGDVLETAVGLAFEHLLVAVGGLEGSQVGDKGAYLDVVELLFVNLLGDVLAPAVPSHLVARVSAVDVGGHVGHLLGRRVATHEAHARDALPAECQHPVQGQRVERTARVGPQVGAVAPRATARAARQVDGQRGLVWHLLEDNVGVEIFKHSPCDSISCGPLPGGLARSC